MRLELLLSADPLCLRASTCWYLRTRRLTSGGEAVPDIDPFGWDFAVLRILIRLVSNPNFSAVALICDYQTSKTITARFNRNCADRCVACSLTTLPERGVGSYQ